MIKQWTNQSINHCLPKDYPIFAIARFHVISGFESEYFSKRIPFVKDMPQYITPSILNLIDNYKYWPFTKQLTYLNTLNSLSYFYRIEEC